MLHRVGELALLWLRFVSMTILGVVAAVILSALLTVAAAAVSIVLVGIVFLAYVLVLSLVGTLPLWGPIAVILEERV